MKRHTGFLPWLLAFSLLAGTFFSSCKKYEDGPVISFKSPEARATNNWQAELISRNEIDVTRNYEYMHMDLKSGGEFVWTAKLIDDAQDSTFNGTWEMATLDQQIKVDYIDPVSFEPRLLYFDIRKLKSDQMWLDYIWKGNKYALRLIPR